MPEIKVRWVRPDQLGEYRSNRLGDGGQGVVYAVPDPPDRLDGSSWVYKEYREPVNADVLHDMCCFLEPLALRERSFLRARLAWPAVMVYDGRPPTAPLPSANPGTRVRGFLMPRVPGEFELYSSQLGQTKAQGLEFLLNEDAYTAKIGLHVDDRQRLRLLIDLARTLVRLHEQHVVVGDLSPKNVMFTLAGQGRCLLIDCDSMRYRGRDVTPQLETPGWTVPEPEKATVASDSLKFGLLAARVFNRSQDDTDVGPLRGISTQLANLATRSRSGEPHRRPSPGDWLTDLEMADNRLKSRPAAGRPSHPTAPTPQPAPEPRPAAAPGPKPPLARTTPSPAAGTLPRPVPPRATSSSWVRQALTVLVLVLVVLGAAVGYSLMEHGHDSEGSGGSGGSPAATSGGSSGTTLDRADDSAAPGSGGKSAPARARAFGTAVDYSRVADEPEAEKVADMFAGFYGAINAGKYDTALRHYDPATTAVDLGSARGRREWKRLMSTTKDSRLVLRSLDTSGDYTLATLSFRSHQSAGLGPGDAPDSTCEDWRVTYQLTHTDGYRIYKAPQGGVSHAAC